MKLSLPSNLDERRLLVDALAQKNGVDLLQWAAVNPQATYLAATITLHDELSALRSDIRGLRREKASGRSLPAAIEMLFDGLLNLADNAKPFATLDELEGVSAPSRALREVLGQLKASYRPLTDVYPGSADFKGKALLIELLKLPEEEDPIEWLRREHGNEVAARALRVVMHRVLPTMQDGPEGSINVLSPHGSVRSTKGYRLSVDEVAFRTSGFAVRSRMWIPDRRRPASPPGLCFPQWRGFDQVLDDLGNWYVVQFAGGAGSKRLWWWESQLRTAIFPAVAGRASQLTFRAESSPLVWESVGGDEMALVTGDEVGELTWSLVLPAEMRSPHGR